MGTDYSFYVKSIATFSLTFFGYIISVLASVLDHDLMTSIWEKAILILLQNLNADRSYLITAVPHILAKVATYMNWSVCHDQTKSCQNASVSIAPAGGQQ